MPINCPCVIPAPSSIPSVLLIHNICLPFGRKHEQHGISVSVGLTQLRQTEIGLAFFIFRFSFAPF